MDLVQALEYARGPGIAVIAGVIISILVEYWSAFQTISSKGKVSVYVLLCLIVPLVATAIGIATGISGVWADFVGTWWPAIAAGLTAAGVGTLFHAYAPENAEAKEANG